MYNYDIYIVKNVAFIHVYICEAWGAMQHRPPNANQEVSNRNHFDSLGRLAASFSLVRFDHPITQSRYRDKHIANIMKVSIDRNKRQLELIRYSKKLTLPRLLLRSDRFNAISPTECISGSFQHNKQFGSVSDSLGQFAAWLVHAMQCNAMQCNAMQCNARQCNAMQCNAKQSKAMQSKEKKRKEKKSNAKQRNATQRNATQRNATQRNATQRNAMPCHAMPCNAMQRTALQRTATHGNALQRNATQRNATQRNATQRSAAQRNAIQYNTIDLNFNTIQYNWFKRSCMSVIIIHWTFKMKSWKSWKGFMSEANT